MNHVSLVTPVRPPGFASPLSSSRISGLGQVRSEPSDVIRSLRAGWAWRALQDRITRIAMRRAVKHYQLSDEEAQKIIRSAQEEIDGDVDDYLGVRLPVSFSMKVLYTVTGGSVILGLGLLAPPAIVPILIVTGISFCFNGLLIYKKMIYSIDELIRDHLQVLRADQCTRSRAHKTIKARYDECCWALADRVTRYAVRRTVRKYSLTEYQTLSICQTAEKYKQKKCVELWQKRFPTQLLLLVAATSFEIIVVSCFGLFGGSSLLIATSLILLSFCVFAESFVMASRLFFAVQAAMYGQILRFSQEHDADTKLVEEMKSKSFINRHVDTLVSRRMNYMKNKYQLSEAQVESMRVEVDRIAYRKAREILHYRYGTEISVSLGRDSLRLLTYSIAKSGWGVESVGRLITASLSAVFFSVSMYFRVYLLVRGASLGEIDRVRREI